MVVTVATGSGSDNEGLRDGGVASLIQMLGALGAAEPVSAEESGTQGQASELLATRSDLQNATEEVVALVMGEALQPSILRIDADAVQAHCTLP